MKTDRDGCHVLPNGECIGDRGCMHKSRSVPDLGHGVEVLRPLNRDERYCLRRACDFIRAYNQLYNVSLSACNRNFTLNQRLLTEQMERCMGWCLSLLRTLADAGAIAFDEIDFRIHHGDLV